MSSRNNDPTSAALNPEPVTFHRDGAVKDLEIESNLHCADGFSAVIGGPCNREQGPELEKESKEAKLLALKREKESPAKRWMQFLEAGKSQSTDFPSEPSKEETQQNLADSLGCKSYERSFKNCDFRTCVSVCVLYVCEYYMCVSGSLVWEPVEVRG